jgi:hypothetical protein
VSTQLSRRTNVLPAMRERRIARDLREAQVPAQVAAAKIEGAAFAAHVALTHATLLSAAEARAIQYAPLVEPRAKAIVDSFAGYACQELSLLAFK